MHVVAHVLQQCSYENHVAKRLSKVPRSGAFFCCVNLKLFFCFFSQHSATDAEADHTATDTQSWRGSTFIDDDDECW
jgi:hypothetical protein